MSNVFIHWKSVLYYVNFEVISMDLVGLSHVVDMPCMLPDYTSMCR